MLAVYSALGRSAVVAEVAQSESAAAEVVVE